jgi:hypothetical protein
MNYSCIPVQLWYFRFLSAAHKTTVASVGEQTLIKGRPVDVAGDSRKHLLAILN